MIRYLYFRQLAAFPLLEDSMFRHRAVQFHDRLGWGVNVDTRGHERDQYDTPDLAPLYVIWEQPDGTHGGSMRFLPTTGPCMINEHFAGLLSEGPIQRSDVWECTRFCLAPGAGPGVSAALMLAGGELLKGLALSHFVGVFDRVMQRVYSRIGPCPVVLGSLGEGRQRVSAGLWSWSAASEAVLAAHADVSVAQSAAWFQRDLGATRPRLPLTA